MDSPDAQIIVFAAPAPVGVGKSIYLAKLISGQCCDASKITFVSQPVNKKGRTGAFHTTTQKKGGVLGGHNSLVSRSVPTDHQVFGLVVADVQVVIVFRDQVHIVEDETVPTVIFQGL